MASSCRLRGGVGSGAKVTAGAASAPSRAAHRLAAKTPKSISVRSDPWSAAPAPSARAPGPTEPAARVAQRVEAGAPVALLVNPRMPAALAGPPWAPPGERAVPWPPRGPSPAPSASQAFIAARPGPGQSPTLSASRAARAPAFASRRSPFPETVADARPCRSALRAAQEADARPASGAHGAGISPSAPRAHAASCRPRASPARRARPRRARGPRRSGARRRSARRSRR